MRYKRSRQWQESIAQLQRAKTESAIDAAEDRLYGLIKSGTIPKSARGAIEYEVQIQREKMEVYL